MPQVVTIFQNIRETETPFFKDVTYILQRIKEGKNQELVKKIRAEKDKTKRNFQVNLTRDLTHQSLNTVG